MSRDFSRVLDSLEVIKPNLLQVVSYHSFEPRCAIILDQEPPHLLDGLQSLRAYVIKNRLSFPLVVTRNFVEKSLDAFPLEFLDIVSSSYHNLFCTEDLLSKLVFAKADLLLQMERELKSKWLLTRLSILEGNPKPKIIAETLRSSLHAITPVLKGFCQVAELPLPTAYPELLAQVTLITGIDLKQMQTWEQLDKADIFHIKNYLELLQSLIDYMEASE